ncbi:MAG TPA: RidA family protein [Hyphomicrobiaceae bacterium]|nr:RidA family protein [Hyphomicrobiaceae bacterium]
MSDTKPAKTSAAPIKRSAPWGGILHEVVEHNDTLYLAGIVAEDLSADITGQSEDALRQLETVLRTHGSDMSRVLQVTIYLADLGEKAGFDAAWKRAFAADHMPARACFATADLGPRVKLELVAIAAKG